MFKILQKFLPEIINLLLTFYLQAQHIFFWVQILYFLFLFHPLLKLDVYKYGLLSYGSIQ